MTISDHCDTILGHLLTATQSLAEARYALAQIREHAADHETVRLQTLSVREALDNLDVAYADADAALDKLEYTARAIHAAMGLIDKHGKRKDE
jgi:predicted lipid-binding transport protein (Tim44 family)